LIGDFYATHNKNSNFLYIALELSKGFCIRKKIIMNVLMKYQAELAQFKFAIKTNYMLTVFNKVDAVRQEYY
jgi:hypothetical protein